MNTPEGTAYIGIDATGRTIYYKLSNNTWFYISKDNYESSNKPVDWVSCLNKPTLTLMKVNTK